MHEALISDLFAWGKVLICGESSLSPDRIWRAHYISVHENSRMIAWKVYGLAPGIKVAFIRFPMRQQVLDSVVETMFTLELLIDSNITVVYGRRARRNAFVIF